MFSQVIRSLLLLQVIYSCSINQNIVNQRMEVSVGEGWFVLVHA